MNLEENAMATTRINITPATASGHRRGWMKLVQSVDTNKTNGYAFDGTFLQEGEQDLPIGSIVVEQYPAGSVKRGYACGEAFRVTENGLKSFATTDDWHKKFLSFRDAVAHAVAESMQPNREGLLQEREKLRIRLAEIDALIKEMV